jgi:anti-sigma regulatory factor (Ser/Thr protein kinase)
MIWLTAQYLDHNFPISENNFPMARPKNRELREFILREIEAHPTDIAPYSAKELGITRASVNGYLGQLLKEGLIEASGKTKGRRYWLKVLDQITLFLKLEEHPEEDIVWRETFYPHFARFPENVLRVCEYGFLEMLNNAIEHSEGQSCGIDVSINYTKIVVTVRDNGVGVFDKITRAYNLADKHEAILELSKGKLTTDRTRHTGEGIFFTSRMFDLFSIYSGGLAYVRQRKSNGEFLIDVEDAPKTLQDGTTVQMELGTHATQTVNSVFERYIDGDSRFSKTSIPLKLAKYEGEHLVSRSQARRIMARVEKFSEIWLDFDGITEIGQPFADEIFRVWAVEHPKVALHPWNFSSEVERMFRHARANATEAGAPEQPSSASERDAKP